MKLSLATAGTFGSASNRRPSAASVWRLCLLCAAGAVAGGVALAALAIAGSAVSASPKEAAPVALPEPAQAAQLAPSAPEQAHPPAGPETVRITGVVGPNLTDSLRAAGVPERQGREYVALLARAIDLSGGLSVDDRFDLVMLRGQDGRPGELAFAGLDRVARADIQLTKWTDGREVRWIDADRLDAGPERLAMPVKGRISSPFGERFHPVLQYHQMHNGVDVAARHGAPIVAAAGGRVVSAGWSGGYGRRVVIAHGDGLQTTYAHMSGIAAAPGAQVRQGQLIGYVGSSGLSTGPHLHYEVRRDGRLVNPLSVKLAQSPLQGEELHAFRARLRTLLLGRPG